MTRLEELTIEITELSAVLRGVVRQKYILSRKGFEILARHLSVMKGRLAELEESEMLKTKRLTDNN